MKGIILGLVTIFATLCSSNGLADAPTCHTNGGNPYCRYTGLIDRIYVNASELILVYFETPILTEQAAAVGFNISNGSATSFTISSNPAFAEYFYSTALAARASGQPVTIQMKNTNAGYLQFDRIWF